MYILPAPSDVAAAFAAMIPLIGPHLGATACETLLGVFLAACFGLAVAFVMDLAPPVKAALYPLLAVSQAVPVLVVAPLLVIYLGFGLAPKIFTVVLMCFFPVAVNVSAAMADVDAEVVNMIRSLGGDGRQVYLRVKFPASLDGFFSGLRVCATYGVTGAVVGEWLSSERGLGFFMLRAKNAYMLDRVFAVIALIAALSLAMLGLVVVLERIFMPYKHEKRAGP
jgi:ABC-type nitrate/sulfonate/bicarbonate transport system permease component